jgi:hypothetical protein
MNRLRCLLFIVIAVIASPTFALGGEIQGPGKNDPSPTASASTTASIEQTQIVLPDATTILMEILLTIF